MLGNADSAKYNPDNNFKENKNKIMPTAEYKYQKMLTRQNIILTMLTNMMKKYPESAENDVNILKCRHQIIILIIILKNTTITYAESAENNPQIISI